MTVALMAITLSFSACKTEGCTDPDSVNYDVEAKKDDGSCLYKGEVVFWYGKTTAENLYAEGSNALTFYVDGKVVGSSNVTVYWGEAPSCGDNGSITVTMDLGKVKTQAYQYKVVDDFDDVLWEGTLNFNANQCAALELTYAKSLKNKK